MAILLIVCGGIPAAAKRPLVGDNKRIIVLDPGHGGQEPGARGPNGTLEKSVTLTLARMVAAVLGPAYEVTLTRTDDYQVDLVKRTALANHLNADLFISIHTGASFAHSTAGTSVYYYQNSMHSSPSSWDASTLNDGDENRPVRWDRIQNRHQGKSYALAQMISARLGDVNTVENCRIQGVPLMVLQGADMPAVLIEVGYLTNPLEEKNLRDQRFLRTLAAEISKAIEDFFSRDPQ
jgi:N-acetylmuramoyl-L-alanine amidase